MPSTPLVPAFGADDQRRVVAALGHGHLCGGRDLLLDALPLLVAVLELGGQPRGGGRVGRQQEVEGQLGLAEAAGGVEARRQPEADVVGRRRPAVRAAHLGLGGQGRDPGAAQARQRAQARRHQDAVLVGERDQVGDRPQRHEIEQVARVEGRRDRAQARAQRGRQVEGHPARSQPLEREGVVGPVRVDERVGGRVALRHLVVIDDDAVDAQRAPDLERLDVARAAVAGHDHAATVGGEPAHVVGAEAVAGLAARHARHHPPAERAQGGGQHRRARDAVDVVVAEDADGLARAQGALDPRERPIEVCHPLGRAEVGEARGQEARRLVSPQDPARHQDLRRERADPHLRRQRARDPLVDRGDLERERPHRPQTLPPPDEIRLRLLRRTARRASGGAAGGRRTPAACAGWPRTCRSAR